MNLETIIGLEIHIQLKTASKMFCRCENVDTDVPPNSAVCPICLGHPGILPVPNRQAIEYALRFALALEFQIPAFTKFDRKHYAYPDLPKGYQISQFDHPIGRDGHIFIDMNGETMRVQFERVHLEEDSAKNIRALNGEVLVDCNRAGTPLLELVTTPTLTSPAEAKLTLQELQRIARMLEISQADMEQGHLRCDANVSLRPVPEELSQAPFPPDDHGLYPKTEIKNLNSFRHVERALAYEIKHQAELWSLGTPPKHQSTRGWDERRGQTVEQRVKEDSADYRYFAEPDLPPIDLPNDYLSKLQREVPELPRAKRQRFQTQYSLSPLDAMILTERLDVANWFEAVVSELQKWFTTREGSAEMPEEEWTKANHKVIRQAASWVTTRLFGAITEKGLSFSTLHITPEDYAEFIIMLVERQMNTTTAQTVLGCMAESGQDPHHILEAGGLQQVSDPKDIVVFVDKVLTENPEIVAEIKAGKPQKAQYLIGQIMKLSKGKADPTIVRELIAGKLGIAL